MLEVAERAMAECDGFLINEVSFDLSLKLDAEGKVRAVKDIQAVDLHDVQNEEQSSSFARAVARLKEIASLPDGWLDGEGLRVLQPAIDVVEGLVRENLDWFAPAGIFPTPEGGIQIELSQDQKDFTIIIDATGNLSGYLVDGCGAVLDLPDRGAVNQAIGAKRDR